MEQEATGSAAGRSKLADAMGWMRRSGTLYVLLAILMASCKSCNCDGCKERINRFFCNVWNNNFGCGQICKVRYQLVDQNGNNVTGVTANSFAILQVNHANNASDIYFSGNVTFDGNGSSPVLPLHNNRCFNPCNSDVAGTPLAFTIFGFTIKSTGNGCPAGQCRYWGFSSMSGDLGFAIENCVIVVKVRVVPGPCGPC